MNNYVLPLDAFIRSIGINKSTPHLFFLGAGASVSSGVPSAERCVWEWKRTIFLTRNPGLEEQFSEISLVGVRQRIQNWLDQQGGFPSLGSQDEYGFYIESCYPISKDRRSYFQEKVQLTQPHIGYKLMCQLAEIDLVKAVWTTNFDALISRAAANTKLALIEIGIDSQNRLMRTPKKGEIICVALHGDYRYDYLKNTPAELQSQESQLCSDLISQLRAKPAVVVGYSGRDASILKAFREAYSIPGTGALYWCGHGNHDLPNSITDIIQLARDNSNPAFYIPTDGFDDLMIRLSLHCCDGEHQERVKKLIADMAEGTSKDRAPFDISGRPTHSVIKSNAFDLECPSEILTFDLNKWPSDQIWSSIRAIIDGHAIVAAPFRGKIIALGLIDDIKDTFGDNIKGQIERTPVTEKELYYEDGVVTSLLKEALIKAITKRTGLMTDGRSELWEDVVLERFQDSGKDYVVHESALVFLRRIGSKQYVLLKPSLRIEEKNGPRAPVELEKKVKLRILGAQFNNKFNQAMENWRKKLFPKNANPVVFEYPDNSASSFRFKIRRSPIFSEIGSDIRRPSIKLSDGVRNLLRHKGVEISEPNLLFSNAAGSGYAKDTHPIRGMINNRPFDFGLSQRGLASLIRLGVICPHPESRSIKTYLDEALRQHRPQRQNPEYLLDYPGFNRAYGLALEIPNCQDKGWVDCPEPISNDPVAGSRNMAERIIRSIDNLMAVYSPHVVLIYFPERWASMRGYRTINDRFDVHDFVKAYCVQRGISTQFLEEKTIKNADQCSVWWWLSLALYVKSMRTPWVLESLDPDTAFVGLGFSIDPAAKRGQHVILGCSHIYSSRGEGLQFRLSKVENPIFRGRNPFMSEEDARRLGETIRQLFFDARLKLPRRVVLHKRTPFIRQEREGLTEGLSGVENIEMYEMQIDHALRYVASVWKNGKLDEDNFPVRRGTTVKLDDFSALVWVHGATTAVDPSRRYFQGRRRIPAPIVLKRHMGNSDLQIIAKELLGLSKMNWNTFDLYTKLPATIHSSNEIARVGSLLQRFGPHSYDFRLFI